MILLYRTLPLMLLFCVLQVGARLLDDRREKRGEVDVAERNHAIVPQCPLGRNLDERPRALLQVLEVVRFLFRVVLNEEVPFAEATFLLRHHVVVYYVLAL